MRDLLITSPIGKTWQAVTFPLRRFISQRMGPCYMTFCCCIRYCDIDDFDTEKELNSIRKVTVGATLYPQRVLRSGKRLLGYSYKIQIIPVHSAYSMVR
jgi:hypothetical protein